MSRTQLVGFPPTGTVGTIHGRDTAPPLFGHPTPRACGGAEGGTRREGKGRPGGRGGGPGAAAAAAAEGRFEQTGGATTLGGIERETEGGMRSDGVL